MHSLVYALRLANHSTHDWAKHVCLVFRNGNMLSAACNVNWRHAEVRALSRVPYEKRSKLTLYSLRFNRSGNLVNARPCIQCYKVIKESGVKTVWYSNTKGKIIKL